ncbi:MAG: DMT family transporter [Pseudomonadota bacterium]
MARLPGNVRGALWVAAAALFFTVMIAMIKVLGQRLPVSQILVMRQTIMLLAVLPVIVRGAPQSLMTRRPGMHAARVVGALVAMYAGFTAAIHLPLADVTAIGFSRTFFITILAIVLLQEVVGPRRWLATTVGFGGVLIMLQPTGEGFNVYGLFAVLAALSAGFVSIIIRVLSQVEAPTTILSYQAVFVGLLVAPMAWFEWRAMTVEDALLAVAIGLASVCGQLCNIRAYRAGEAVVVSSVDYVRLVWATLLGLVLFAQLPSLTTVGGALIIVSASAYTLVREMRRKPRTPAAGRTPDVGSP